MADILSMISVISYLLAALFLAVSIILWIKFKIPFIIGDLTGRTARKSIAQMRENHKKTGVKAYASSKVKMEDFDETGLLKDNEAGDALGRMARSADTGVLNEAIAKAASDDAAIILNNEAVKQKNEVIKEIGFRIIEEVVLIHTKEVIMRRKEEF